MWATDNELADNQTAGYRGAYRELSISVPVAELKIFVYMSRYKQRKTVLSF